jgi:hypothetical protein
MDYTKKLEQQEKQMKLLLDIHDDETLAEEFTPEVEPSLLQNPEILQTKLNELLQALKSPDLDIMQTTHDHTPTKMIARNQAWIFAHELRIYLSALESQITWY